MRKLLFTLLTIHFSLFSSPARAQLTVEVKNPTKDFRHEVVGINAADVKNRVGDSFRVLEGAGLDVPYQLTHDGQLLIEAAVRPQGTARFRIVQERRLSSLLSVTAPYTLSVRMTLPGRTTAEPTASMVLP